MNVIFLLAIIGISGVLFILVGHNGHAQLNQSLTHENKTNELKYFQSDYMGISFQYPSEWGPPIDHFYECKSNNNCLLSFIKFDDPSHSYAFQVRAFQLDKPIMSLQLNRHSESVEPCSCNKLRDFVGWYYSHNKIDDLISDNQTSIGKNYSAWQIESKSRPDSGEVIGFTKLYILSLKDKLGYMFIYGGTDSNFKKYLDGFKNMLKSVKLSPSLTTTKTLSFVN